jgi:hypothetical protein
MYAKVFEQIFDSSIADNWKTRLVYEDLLVLADQNGVVDKTQQAIARRTNVPLEIVLEAIAELESPDPRSRNPIHEGRRIVRIDEHRDWGWLIVNYDEYRRLASEEQKREKTRARVQKFRAERENVTLCNASLRSSNDSPSASVCTSSSVLPAVQDGSEEGGKRGKLDKFGEFGRVRLSVVEYEKLVAGHGQEKTDAGIAVLDAYIEQKGKRYKNHYACMNETSWVWEKVAKVVKPSPAHPERRELTPEEQAAELERERALYEAHVAKEAETKRLAREVGR